MKLYIVHGSPNCRRALAVVKHLELDIELCTLDFRGGDLRKSEYLAINPNAKVPALEDGSFKLWESNAIMQYLASLRPGTSLFPQDPQRRADIVRWQCWELAHFGNAASTLVFERVVKPMLELGPPNPVLVDAAETSFRRFAAVLDGQLQSREFVTGPDVTLADYSIGASLMYVQPAQLPLADFAHVTAWYRRVEQLPAWSASAPPSGGG